MEAATQRKLIPKRPRDQQAIAIWIEAALGGDPILMTRRSGLRVEVILDRIQEVAARAACSEEEMEHCSTELRAVRDTIVPTLCSVFAGKLVAEAFLATCLRTAEELDQSIGQLWEELLNFEDGQDLVAHILALAREPLVELFPDRSREIDVFYDEYDRIVESGRQR